MVHSGNRWRQLVNLKRTTGRKCWRNQRGTGFAMEGKAEDSPIQYSLCKNLFIIRNVNYSSIAEHLILKGIQLQGQHAILDNGKIMDELVSTLINMNSLETFDSFREALIHADEVELANELKADFQWKIIDEMAKAGKSLPYLPNEVWKRILGLLPTNDLLNARLTCIGWNSIATQFHMSRFTMRFEKENGNERMKQFVKTGITSVFCRKLSKFAFKLEDRLRTQDPSAVEKGVKFESRAFYKTFFVEFGLNITELELTGPCRTFVIFLFSREIQPHLKNVTTLKLGELEMREVMAGLGKEVTFSFLSGLEYLFLNHSDVNGYDYHGNCKYYAGFLQKFLTNNHHRLKGIVYMCNSISCSSRPIINRCCTPYLLNGGSLAQLHLSPPLTTSSLVSLTAPPPGSGHLKDVSIDLDEDVTSTDFHNFLASHQRTLQQLQVTSKYIFLANKIPQFDALEVLSLDFKNCSPPSTILNLAFSTRAPNLKSLEIQNWTFSPSPPDPSKNPLFVPPFQHVELECLTFRDIRSASGHYLKILYSGILTLLEQIPACFPNLRKLVLVYYGYSNRSEWPRTVGPLTLQPIASHGLVYE